jgi:hypothetical protein
MSSSQAKALAGLFVALCGLVSAFWPQFAAPATAFAGLVGMLSPALLGKPSA